MLRNLKDKLVSWAVVKLVYLAFSRMESENVGRKLDAFLDAKLKDKSEKLQKPLAAWLHQVASQLTEDA